ncbi:tetratricopeptide repeat protein [Pyxidicoccus xibeiensis]|uniref:tetratricopeptide repeat protein n=1 Tax=Pyxidicoccus xibeiensis TaxID=2906759 RepID=UPI0020A74DAF|nr:tetratricopeptide repeat protein [Pyxidicoccus xibeiensis]MCP3137346.1 tetratricopeptide repeat protein [Pyxidicoccus xibeiensis]
MGTRALAVTVAGGVPQVLPSRALEVDVGVALPVAFGGLRRVLRACESAAPEVVGALSRAHPSEWNRLFPGSIQGVPDLADLALTPSERRLHRESEQMFWVLNVAAKAIVETLRASGRPLVLHGAGECDLVSLRAVMRAAEWSRLEGLDGTLLLTGWNVRRPHGAVGFEARRQAYLDALCDRMRAPRVSGPGPVSSRQVEPAVDLEGRYLQLAVDGTQAREDRVAAAILAIRSCFFTTNYEGALLAAEQGLALLDSEQGPDAELPGRVARAWDALDTGFTTPAIEIDRSSLGDAEELRALFLRSMGVVHVFTGSHEAAMEAFARGLQCRVPPELVARLHMFRALTLTKRFGQLPNARVEVEAGLAALERCTSADRALQEGWLRNVCALTWFQERKLDKAVVEEKLAMRCVGDLHDASATHLKINLISNASYLQETARQYGDAIATWRRFEKISAKWGANFAKHHCYRLAGLELAAGERDAAEAHFTEAYANADALGDSFHRQVIAAELGRMSLDAGQPATAVEWFARGEEHARAVGDPLKTAECLAGLALAGGRTDWTEALRCVQASTTWPKETEALRDALSRADAAAVHAALPRARTKLNRPFDPVNLY